MLVVAEWAGLFAVEVEGTQADGADLERKSEDGADARLQDRSRKGRPASVAGSGQIGFEHRSPLCERIDAWSLAQHELHILDKGAHGVGGAH